MESAETYYSKVEKVILELGVDATKCRGEKAGQWTMFIGSAEVWIDIFSSDQNGSLYFQVMTPIMMIPSENKEAFFKELLEINHLLYGVAFTIYNEGIYIKSIRECDHLDENEILAQLNRAGFYSDQYDDYLKAKYASNQPGKTKESNI